MANALANVPNIALNAVLPVNPMKGMLVAGSAEYIAAEVVVSKFLRKLMGWQDKSFFELAYIHAVSLPFLGGAGSFAAPAGSYTEGYVSQVTSGAKGVPAVLLAQWVVETCFKGFHVPRFSMKDVFITAASKSLTQPLISIVFKNLPADMASALNVVGEMARKQNAGAFTYAKTR